MPCSDPSSSDGLRKDDTLAPLRSVDLDQLGSTQRTDVKKRCQPTENFRDDVPLPEGKLASTLMTRAHFVIGSATSSTPPIEDYQGIEVV